ncbi:MAG: ribosomal protein S18-alanine N-acetyltransferase [Gammaproteobacteria bacterium]|nr:ribosomal protein S18-alanine N-acetyltransferase [Gammaproteobacteria bacterium]
MEPEFRNMTDADLISVCAIEESEFEFPWSENIFKSCLGDGYYACVMVEHEVIIAYGVISCVADEAQILNLCVKFKMQRQGVGRSMLMRLLLYACRVKVKAAFLEVRRSNKRAIEFYSRIGFSEVGLRKGYYPAHENREDAVVMAFELKGSLP